MEELYIELPKTLHLDIAKFQDKIFVYKGSTSNDFQIPYDVFTRTCYQKFYNTLSIDTSNENNILLRVVENKLNTNEIVEIIATEHIKVPDNGYQDRTPHKGEYMVNDKFYTLDTLIQLYHKLARKLVFHVYMLKESD